MIDKKVVICDFHGIKPGYLVRLQDGRVGTVLETYVFPRMLDEGHGEFYEPVLEIILGNKRVRVYPNDVTVLEGDR